MQVGYKQNLVKFGKSIARSPMITAYLENHAFPRNSS